MTAVPRRKSGGNPAHNSTKEFGINLTKEIKDSHNQFLRH